MSKWLFLLPVIGSFALSGCSAWHAHRDGIGLVNEGKVDQGLIQLETASKLAPENMKYRAEYFLQRDKVIAGLLEKIERAERQQHWDEAAEHSRMLLQVAPDSARAQGSLLRQMRAKYLHDQLTQVDSLLAKGALADAALKLQSLEQVSWQDNSVQERKDKLALLQSIHDQDKRVLGEQFGKTISLELRDAGLRQIFEILSKETKVNFILDKDVRPELRTTVFLKDTPLKDIIRFICTTNQLQFKVLNEKTLMIYPATDEKKQQYEDLQTRTFYLSAGNAKELASIVKDMAKIKDAVPDEQLNALTVRANEEVMSFIEKLVTSQDVARPEVMLDLEVMEISSRLLDEIGIKYPGGIGVSASGAGGAGVFTIAELKNANSGIFKISIGDPALILNLREETGDSKILANPKIRVKNKIAAKVHIGDKVPLISSTINGSGTVSESISYQDVGLKLDVEPNIKINNEVEIKVGLEVSNLLERLTTPAGSQAYRIGTRSATTVLSLKDGETQILAGLVQREEKAGLAGLPGLSRLPLLGPLFSTHKDETSRSEIVLLITPRIIRNANPSFALQSFPSGTAFSPGAPPLLLPSMKPQQAQDNAPFGADDEDDTVGPLQWGLPLYGKAGGSVELLLKLDRKSWKARSFSGQLNFDPYRLQILEVLPSASLQPSLEDGSFMHQINNQQGRLLLGGKLKEAAKEGEWIKIKVGIKPSAQGPVLLTSSDFAAQDGSGKPLRLPQPVEQKITVMP